MTMTEDVYVRRLGRLIHHLASLEVMLRFHLYSVKDAPHEAFPEGVNPATIEVGEILPVNAVTDYSQLGKLIERFNARASTALAIDTTIVDLRDAVAHGRLFDHLDVTPTRRFLLKFSKPVDGKCSATIVEELDEAWFRRQDSRVLAAIENIWKATPADHVTKVAAPRRGPENKN